jgi:hypothetical protein
LFVFLFLVDLPEVLVSGLLKALLCPGLPLPDLTPKSETDYFLPKISPSYVLSSLSDCYLLAKTSFSRGGSGSSLKTKPDWQVTKGVWVTS